MSGSMQRACASHAPTMSQYIQKCYEIRLLLHNFRHQLTEGVLVQNIIHYQLSIKSNTFELCQTIHPKDQVYRNTTRNKEEKPLNPFPKKRHKRSESHILDMQNLLKDIVTVLFGKRVRTHSIDNFVFRLHYRVTTAGLIAAAILVSITILPSLITFCRLILRDQ